LQLCHLTCHCAPCRYTAQLQQQRRHQDLGLAWQRQCTSFLATAQQLLARSHTEVAAAAESAGEHLAWAAAGEKLRHKLQQLREEHTRQHEAASAALRARQHEAAALQQLDRAARERYQAAARQAVAEFRQQQAAALTQQRVEQAAAEAAAAAAARAVVDAAKPAVAARAAEREEKHRQQQVRPRIKLAWLAPTLA
jgi:hypothetical protein